MLDFGGGTFAPLARAAARRRRRAPAPSPTSCAGSSPRCAGIVDRREAYFRAHGIDSIETYRSRRRGQGRADDGYGDVFLVVDGWSTLRAEFDDLEIEIQRAGRPRPDLRRALVVTASRWVDFRSRDARRVRHPARAAARRPASTPRSTARSPRNVPDGPARPRAWSPTKLHFLARAARGSTAAAPPTTSATASRTSSTRVSAAWTGPARAQAAAAARARSRSSGSASWPAPERPARLLLGIDESDLAPVGLDLGRASRTCSSSATAQSGKRACCAPTSTR